MGHQSSDNCGGEMEAGCDKLVMEAGGVVANQTLKGYAGQIESLHDDHADPKVLFIQVQEPAQ